MKEQFKLPSISYLSMKLKQIANAGKKYDYFLAASQCRGVQSRSN